MSLALPPTHPLSGVNPELLTTVFHRTGGATVMFAADASAACNHHPAEWSRSPWPADADDPSPQA
jgi:hypothetical protein